MSRRERMLGLLDRLQQAQLRLAATALVLLMFVTVVDVFLRYLFNSPLRGSYELVESLLVIFVFHGMSASFLRRQNIAIDIIDSFLSARFVETLIRLADVMTIGCLLLIFWAMLNPAIQAFHYGDRKLELGLPIFVLWLLAFLGLAGTILAALGALLSKRSADKDGPLA
jgi:TRAP-type C4-dicarboxylate transport system permease small subunit